MANKNDNLCENVDFTGFWKDIVRALRRTDTAN